MRFFVLDYEICSLTAVNIHVYDIFFFFLCRVVSGITRAVKHSVQSVLHEGMARRLGRHRPGFVAVGFSEEERRGLGSADVRFRVDGG